MGAIDHQYALLCHPTIFHYTKVAAKCSCGWQGEWMSPDGAGKQLAQSEHWDHRMDVDPPRRYQRKRNVSADIPIDAKYVGRPTKWGNEFPVGQECTLDIGGSKSTFVVRDRTHAVSLFRQWQLDGLRRAALKELRGKDLVCWCPLDEPCHADVLLEIANG